MKFQGFKPQILSVSILFIGVVTFAFAYNYNLQVNKLQDQNGSADTPGLVEGANIEIQNSGNVTNTPLPSLLNTKRDPTTTPIPTPTQNNLGTQNSNNSNNNQLSTNTPTNTPSPTQSYIPTLTPAPLSTQQPTQTPNIGPFEATKSSVQDGDTINVTITANKDLNDCGYQITFYQQNTQSCRSISTNSNGTINGNVCTFSYNSPNCLDSTSVVSINGETKTF